MTLLVLRSYMNREQSQEQIPEYLAMCRLRGREKVTWKYPLGIESLKNTGLAQ